VPTPAPDPGEVRVRILVSGFTSTDWKARKRSGASAAPLAECEIPHHDGADVIDAVGPGMSRRAARDRVWVYFAAFPNRWGTEAEYAVLPAERTRPLPESASFKFGASLGIQELTAAHCLDSRPEALRGHSILVTGGAGAVGHYAIELAHAA